MLYLNMALFALAAVLGVTILYTWVTKKDTPRAVVYSHGIAAATALVLLVVYALQNPENYPKVSIILFVIAASGGFYMFINDMAKRPNSLFIALFHALLAVSGFLTLLFFAFA
jgi:hypothetical protein